MTILKNWLVLPSVCVLSLCASTAAFAHRNAAVDADASAALALFYQQNAIHRELADKAVGMLVFPHVVKGGAAVGGEYGEGVLIIEGQPVRHYLVQGGSAALTAGAVQHSEVIMFMSTPALVKFVSSKGWVVDSQSGIAVMSTGAGGGYDPQSLKKPVLGFVFGETGSIGDVSLAGLKFTMLDNKS
jgi:lipid-binding SYLF domain-containing protein